MWTVIGLSSKSFNLYYCIIILLFCLYILALGAIIQNLFVDL